MANRGKQFETKFRDDWLESVPESFCYRIHDQMSGYVNIGNISDFICYKYPYCFIIDCKVKEGNTIPFSDLRQYERMLSYVGVPGLHLGFMWWAVSHDKVIWIPVETLEKIKNDGSKSYNIKMLNNPEYPSFEVASKKLRTFLKTDYNDFINKIKQGELNDSN